MEYSDTLLREALPEEPPPFEYIPKEVIEEIERNVREDDIERSLLVARSAQWTYAMFAEIQLGRFSWDHRYWDPDYWGRAFAPWQTQNTLHSVAIGLLEPEPFGAGFGLTLMTYGHLGLPEAWDLGRIDFLRLERSFRVVLMRGEIEDHSPPHPAGGTSAAWARCNRTQNWGILTAGHAVGSVPGRNIRLAGGEPGRVDRTCHPLIDAAFVHTIEAPTAARIMPVGHFPAAGRRVTVGCQPGPVERTVIRVEDNMGVVNTLSRAALLYTDQCCSPGDSGALVQADGGDAVGIYLGSLKTPLAKSGQAGRVLSFGQALFALDVTAYD